MIKIENIHVGDLLEVVRNDDRAFKCIVVEKYDEGFVGKVLSREEGVGTATWIRYGLVGDSRFQMINECKDIKILAEAKKVEASNTLKLLEEGVKDVNPVTYYETPISDSEVATFCVCNGYGGWSFRDKTEKVESLKESFFKAYESEIKSRRSET